MITLSSIQKFLDILIENVIYEQNIPSSNTNSSPLPVGNFTIPWVHFVYAHIPVNGHISLLTSQWPDSWGECWTSSNYQFSIDFQLGLGFKKILWTIFFFNSNKWNFVLKCDIPWITLLLNKSKVHLCIW